MASKKALSDRVADDFGRKTVSVIGRSAAFHPLSFASGDSTIYSLPEWELTRRWATLAGVELSASKIIDLLFCSPLRF